MRGATVSLMCRCGERYVARQADLDRGWGKSCSKRCAARRREAMRQRPNRTKRQQRVIFGHAMFYGHPLVSGDEGHGQE
jgi:hypothetical protein